MNLHLGCGHKRIDGYINVDKYPSDAVDQLVDLELTWPWADNTVEKVVLHHTLEHLGETTAQFRLVMKEMYRVCCDKANVSIIVPHPRCDDFLNDPTHVRVVTPQIMSLFDRAFNLKCVKQGASNTPLALQWDVDFELVAAAFRFPPQYKDVPDSKIMELLQLPGTCREIVMGLTVHKPARTEAYADDFGYRFGVQFYEGNRIVVPSK